jgi:hypothetical protein
MNKQLLIVCFCLSLASAAFAAWSPEIELFVGLPGGDRASGPCAVSVDSLQNVHLVFAMRWRKPTDPGSWPPRCGMFYTKFNDHGQILVPPFMIGDSLDTDAEDVRILCFGTDSLWIVWERYHDLSIDTLTGTTYSRARVVLGLDGSVLHALDDWPETPFGVEGDKAGITVSPDRKVIAIYTDRQNRLRCVVQNPDGSRIMNHTIIADMPLIISYPFDANVDATDSLQLSFDLWYAPLPSCAAYSKRISILQDYSGPLDDASPISIREPGQIWGVSELLPHQDDSLIVCRLQGPGDSIRVITSWLEVLRRTDYSRVAERLIEDMHGTRIAAFEPDGSITTFDYHFGQESLYFQRYSYPSLTLVTDSLFFQTGPQQGINAHVYTVSSLGVRHVIYGYSTTGQNSRLVYRFWPGDQGVNDRGPQSNPLLDFTVWPNPTTQGISIEGPLSSVKQIVVYNVLGRQVLSFQPGVGESQRVMTPDISLLPSGPYFVHLITSRGNTVRRIVMQR